MLRLFVGLSLPPAVCERLAMLQAGIPGARWVAPGTFHLTLRFFGETDRGMAADLDEALSRLAFAPFALTLDGVGWFGTRRRPDALWAGVERNAALAALHDKVGRIGAAIGLAGDDRKFAPHVTLARLMAAPPDRVGRWIESHALFRAGPMPADAVHLYESRLGSAGATYAVLRSYPATLASSGD
jgi:2'-5' RNA ligase